MRKAILLAMLFSGQSAYAATETFDFSMTFEREFFQDAFDGATSTMTRTLYDGASLGFSGPFSALGAGDTATASVEVEEQGGYYTVTSCEFAGLSCDGDFVTVDPGKSLLVWNWINSYFFDLDEGVVRFVRDTAGQSDAGFFRAYGAEFALVSGTAEDRVEVVPAPVSAALLLSGLALLGLRRRRRG